MGTPAIVHTEERDDVESTAADDPAERTTGLTNRLRSGDWDVSIRMKIATLLSVGGPIGRRYAS